MSNSNGVITAPVSIEDVKTVLGLASNDLKTLCESTNVNVFSKIHPLPLLNEDDTPGQIDDAMRKKYNYGIIPLGSIATLDDMQNELVAALNNGTFVYTLVNARSWNLGYSVHHRLTDFAGYNHKASLQGNELADSSTTDAGQERSVYITFAEGSRTLTYSNLDTDKKVRLHDDSIVIEHFLSSTYTDAKGDGSGMSILDIVYSHDGGTNLLSASATRGLLFFKKNANSGSYECAAWIQKLYNQAAHYDYVDFGLENQIVYTEQNGTQVMTGKVYLQDSNSNYLKWSELEGDFVVVEFYHDTNIYVPIPNMAYALTIKRTTIVNTDINTLTSAVFAFSAKNEEVDGLSVIISFIPPSGSTASSLFSTLTVGIYSDQYGQNLINNLVKNWADLAQDSTQNLYDFIEQWTTATTDVNGYCVIKGTTTAGAQGILAEAITLKSYK